MKSWITFYNTGIFLRKATFNKVLRFSVSSLCVGVCMFIVVWMMRTSYVTDILCQNRIKPYYLQQSVVYVKHVHKLTDGKAQDEPFSIWILSIIKNPASYHQFHTDSHWGYALTRMTSSESVCQSLHLSRSRLIHA